MSDQSILFTVTAPIKHPAKTGAALQELLRDLPDGEFRKTINGNEVRVRIGTISSIGKLFSDFLHTTARLGWAISLTEPLNGDPSS